MKKLVLFITLTLGVFSSLNAQHLVIAELYGGGGNTGAFYKNDYIVIYNQTASAINFTTSPYSVQYASASGTSWSVTVLTGSIAANGYYIIQEASGGAVGATLPIAANVTGTINMSATNGKLALVSQTATITGAGLPNAAVVDFVGFGTANTFEGTAAAPAGSNTSCIRRNGSGTIDNNQNSTDFSVITYSTDPNVMLPVELSSFTSIVKGRDIFLNWETKTEINSSKFEIERILVSAKDVSVKWESVGTIQASGSSNSPKKYSYAEKNLPAGKYQYRLKMVDNDGTFNYSKVTEVVVSTPMNFELSQNYPNPFNPSTKINYSLPSDSRVTLEVFNVLGVSVGQLVNKDQSAGYYSVDFNSSSLSKSISSGVYLYKISTVEKATGNSFSSIKKMMMLK